MWNLAPPVSPSVSPGPGLFPRHVRIVTPRGLGTACPEGIVITRESAVFPCLCSRLLRLDLSESGPLRAGPDGAEPQGACVKAAGQAELHASLFSAIRLTQCISENPGRVFRVDRVPF